VGASSGIEGRCSVRIMYRIEYEWNCVVTLRSGQVLPSNVV
jgi:hypothetical protein